MKESMWIEKKLENLMKDEFPKLILKNQLVPARTGELRYNVAIALLQRDHLNTKKIKSQQVSHTIL